ALPILQAPAWQVSVCVQALPSLHAVPSAAAGLEHCPVPGLQTPAVWHWSLAAHATGFDPVQVPDWQVSVCVQALPSLHAVPSALAGLAQPAAGGLLLPAEGVGSPAVHGAPAEPGPVPEGQGAVRGDAAAPRRAPSSVCVQALPSLHAVPSATLVWTHPATGSQLSTVHGLWSSQFNGVPATQAPDAQVSWPLQRFPSSHSDAPSSICPSQLLSLPSQI